MVDETKDFAAEIAQLESTMRVDEVDSVYGLRREHESWALALLGIGGNELLIDGNPHLVSDVRRIVESGLDPVCAAEAAEKFVAAEKWQEVIGTWATGSGEGMSSMLEVHTLQLARAWVLSAGLPDQGNLAEVRMLIYAVTNANNGVADRLRPDVDALLARVNSSQD